MRSPVDPRLEVRSLTLAFRGGGGVHDVSLAIPQGETLALLGPSGAGKSSLINLIAGISAPQQGHISIDGVDVTRCSPGQRGLGVVFQDAPLYDHLSARENVLLALSSLTLTQEERSDRVADSLKIVDMTKLSSRHANVLSGGERARLAIARVLARRPKVALLDEPYAPVDRLFRKPLREAVTAHLQKIGAAVLHVTHDPNEAKAIAHRVAIMIDGSIRQVGTFEEVCAQPCDSTVEALLNG